MTYSGYKTKELRNAAHKRYRQEHLEELRAKDREYYHIHKNDPEKRQKRREYMRMYRLRNREERLAKGRQWYRRLKLEVLGHYSNSQSPHCAICGIDDLDVLCIDHVNGGGGQHRARVGGRFYDWLKRQGFPEGYQVLCANCNLKKRVQSVGGVQ